MSRFTIAVYDEHGSQVNAIDVDAMPDMNTLAAAPDLLVACKAMEQSFCDGFLTKEHRHQARQALIAARAAISKATGADK